MSSVGTVPGSGGTESQGSATSGSLSGAASVAPFLNSILGRLISRGVAGQVSHDASPAVAGRYGLSIRKCIAGIGTLLVAGWIAASSIRADTAIYLRGEAEHRAYLAGQELVHHYSFQAILAAPQWLIRVKRLGEADVAYHEAGFANGNEVYYVMRYSDEVVARSDRELAELRAREPDADLPEVLEVALGRVSTGSYPWAVNEPAIRFLWFGLASAEHLDRLPADRCEPFYLLETWPDHAAQVFLERTPAAPRLPARAVFLSDGVIDSTRRSARVLRYPPPFDKGFTNAVYSVTRSTNRNGMVLPLAAEVVVYLGRPEARSDAEVQPAYVFSFAVTNLEEATAPRTFQPALPGLTLVSDERFATDTNLALRQLLYTTTRWRELNEVSNSREYQEARESARRLAAQAATARTRNRGASLVGMVLVSAAVVAPLVVVCLARLRHNQSKTR